MTLRMVDPGLMTTVQDLGRTGHQQAGVPVSGAMDGFALRMANLLAGNREGDAALEITLAGARVHFEDGTLVAIAGADLGAEVDGVAVPPWRPAWIPAGGTLGFRRAASGCRAYLAVAGGVDLPRTLGSRSTYVRAALGGVEGRPLRAGDELPVGEPSPLAGRIAASVAAGGGGGVAVSKTGIGFSLRPCYSDRVVVRMMAGEHADSLTPDSRGQLYGAEFHVSPRSDRNGYRLEGARLELTAPLEILSEAVAFGTVQLPPDGIPIILMADRQTTGGYPRIGEVASVDLPLLGQLKPGDRVAFRPCSLADAQALYLAREREIDQVRKAISLVYRGA